MEILDALRSLLPLARGASHGCLLALVGAGGKTSALYDIASSAAALGLRTIATTTTRMADPRLEPGRLFDRLVVDASLAGLKPPDRGEVLLVFGGVEEGSGKLTGISPRSADALRAMADLVLVEADGSRGLPIKAPGPNEPVMPALTDLVLGFVGLDALGRPLGPDVAHRPELLARILGIGNGAPIGISRLPDLIGNPLGLFKGRPPSARSCLVLNKADAVAPAFALEAFESAATLVGVAVDLVLLASLIDPRPSRRIRAFRGLPAGQERRCPVSPCV